jgi:hypothetical protein
MTNNEKITVLKELIERQVAGADETVKAFAAKLAGPHPSHELEWADNAFAAAAKVEVFGQALRFFGAEGFKPEEYLAKFERDFLIRARNVSSSSSASHNFIAQHRIAAMAELIDLFRGALA